MKLIIGLGNPGEKYQATRHNVGFMVADLIADRLAITMDRVGWKSIYGKGKYHDTDIMILKPQTYMNLSGEAVGQVCRYFKVAVEDVMVIYDDMDLPTGKVKLRPAGGAGGHKGLLSIIEHLGSEKIIRIKVGIGRPQYHNPVDYVTGIFSEEQWEEVAPAIKRAADAATALIEESVDIVMNNFNG